MGVMRQETSKQKSNSRRVAPNPHLPAGAARLWHAGALAYLASASLVWGVLLALWLGGQGGRDRSGDVLGPDFPAFYTAGWMLRHGEAARLYDFERQEEVQRSLGLSPRPPASRGVSAFINPPHYALLMAPLSALSYRAAFAVWSALMLGCFVAGLLLLRSLLSPLRERSGLLPLALALFFMPVYFAFSAGQNTGLSLLLHSGILAALARRRDALAGGLIAVGLLKPQLFLGLLPLLLIARRPKALAAFSLGAALVGLLTLLVLGSASFAQWWSAIRSSTYEMNIAEQAPKMFEWHAFWQLLLGVNALSSALGWMCALLVFAGLCLMWRRVRNGDSDELMLCYAITICGTVVMVPHLFVYDLALLVLPGLVIAARLRQESFVSWRALPGPQLGLRVLLPLIYVGAIFWEQAQQTRVQFLVPLLTLALLPAGRLIQPSD